MAQSNVLFAPGADPEEQAIRSRLQWSQALRQQQTPMQGQMVSGRYVGASPLEGLANMLRAYTGRKGEEKAMADYGALQEKRKAESASDVQGYISALRGTPAHPTGQTFETGANEMGDEAATQQQFSPAVAGDPDKALAMALASRNPLLQQLAAGQMKQMTEGPKVVGRSLIANDGRVVGVDSTWQAEQQAAREQRMTELQARLEDQRTAREEKAALARELQEMRAQQAKELRTIAGSMRQPQAPVAVMGDDGKPVYVSPAEAVGKRPASKTGENKLPNSALKMQQEELEAINTAGSIVADVTALQKQIDSGELKLGPVQNLVSAGRNVAGASNENSRNFAAFKTSLEKLRNDSLRLNKGVQTEGDAQRAWDELVGSINDPKVVSRQLAKINDINQRAIGLRRMNIDTIRQNFGVEPLDTTPQANQAPALGQGGNQFKILNVREK